MRIEAVDFFYLAMPEVTVEADGSQDALLVRVRRADTPAGANAKPLPALDRGVRVPEVAWGVPPGRRIGAGQAAARSIRHRPHVGRGRLQFDGPAAGRAHLVGRRDRAVGLARQGARRAGVEDARLRQELHPKTPYASVLFGDTPAETLARARDIRAKISAPRSSAGARSDAARPRRTPSILSPRAKGSARTRSCWSIPGRSSSTTLRAPPNACRRWSRRVRPGSRSRSPRVRLRPMGRWRSAAGT